MGLAIDMKRFITVILGLLLLISATTALNFDVNIDPDSITIKLNESAHFTLNVSHDSVKTEFFEIYSPDVVWDILFNPVGDRLLEVHAGESKSTNLIITPVYGNPGFYGVGLHIRHSGGKDLEKKAIMIGSFFRGHR